MARSPMVALNDGVSMPAVGLGVFKIPDEQAGQVVQVALETGYRSIDTAALYGNEAGVGRGIGSSEVAREDVFVATKLWNDRHGEAEAAAAFEESRARLGLDVVDLYLIHWPCPAQDRYVQTWRALLRLQEEGLVRSIGVSNFSVAHLQRIIDETGVVPAVNQVELHPWLQQAELRAFHDEHDIATEAWSPLARGGDLLANDVITGIATRHEATPAQVVLRWHLQLGNVVIPKSVTPARIAENLDVFGLTLTAEEMDRIAGLDEDRRTGPDPDSFG